MLTEQCSKEDGIKLLELAGFEFIGNNVSWDLISDGTIVGTYNLDDSLDLTDIKLVIAFIQQVSYYKGMIAGKNELRKDIAKLLKEE